MLAGETQDELTYLKMLADQLKASATDFTRLEILNCDPKIVAFFESPSWLRTALSGLSLECELVIKSLIAIDQKELFHLDEGDVHFTSRLRALLDDLIPVERFYKAIGGIIGYHYVICSLMRSDSSNCEQQRCLYHRPPGYDISSETQEVNAYVLEGIRALATMGELYPVGGAADRLHLIDPDTGLALPAAQLRFCGKTLLEGLIADVQAREYLFYQLFDQQITVPIAMMTSQEKDNHRQILSICEENKWFGRPQSAFHFFCQNAVPLVDIRGVWCQSESGKLLMKPGGHGVIWKMARDSGVFDAWKKAGIHKMLVRQINNPVAGTDYGLLAFCGIGYRENKAFGFASCPRQIASAEGINVLLERACGEKDIEYCLTNVEYCNFKKWGIEDKPAQEGSCYSLFPSNTNILFADMETIEQAIEELPIPGMIVNLKKIPQLIDRQAARLESTMQNIADYLIDRLALQTTESLKTFITYNLRRKTISTTKRAFDAFGPSMETPEGCFYDVLQNAYNLLKTHCHFDLPSLGSVDDYLQQGPAWIFLYHPALGPLYSIIGQKLRKGILKSNSELQLDIAEIDCEELHLEGSLKITAENIMGDRSADGQIRYSDQTGKCMLRRLKVRNRGIDKGARSCYWKNEITRHELCEIIIRGNGEFMAEDVSLQGNWRIEVDPGFRVRAVMHDKEVLILKEKIETPQWQWKYCISDGRILLK